MGQIKLIEINAHKMNDFLEALIEYKPKDVEHIVPKEMIEMHKEKKTEAK